MLRRPSRAATTRRLGRLSYRISRWLHRAGVAAGPVSAHIANDLIEILVSADRIKGDLESLLRQDPATKRGARASARRAMGIGVVASTELLSHTPRLTRHWEGRVVDLLYDRAER